MNGIHIEAGGKSYRAIFTTNALCALEQHLGSGVADIIGGLADRGGLNLTKARALFWASLIENCPELTLPDAGRIMDAIGITKASALVSAAIIQAFPDTAPAAGGGGPLADAPRPDGIGVNSLKNGPQPDSRRAISGG